MPTIIDHLLRGNDELKCLDNIKIIHEELGLQVEFTEALNKYAFSKQCLLSQCIGLIVSGYVRSREVNDRFLKKALESKFELFANYES